MNNGNFHLTYNLNTIFNQAGLSNEAIKAAGRSSKPKKIEKQNKESLIESNNKLVNKTEESINTEGNNQINKNKEDDYIDETLSDNNISKKKKLKISNLKKSNNKLSKPIIENSYNKNNNLLENTNIENNINKIPNEDNLVLQDSNIKTDTLSEHITEENQDRKNGNKKSKKFIGINKKENSKNCKKMLNNKRKRNQEEEQDDQFENEISSSSNNDDEEDYSEINEKSKKKPKIMKKNLLTNNKKYTSSHNIKNNFNFKFNGLEKSEDYPKSKMEPEYIEDFESFNVEENVKLKYPKIQNNDKNQENNIKDNYIKEEISEDININSIHSKNNLSSKYKNPKIEEKHYNKISVHRLNENDYDYSSSLRPNKTGKMISRYLNKSAESADEENSLITGKAKRLTRSTNTEVIKGKWKDKCYICLEHGDLICCEACSNVAHKFCACIEVIILNI